MPGVTPIVWANGDVPLFWSRFFIRTEIFGLDFYTSCAVLIEIIKVVNISKIHRGFKESGMQSCRASQLL